MESGDLVSEPRILFKQILFWTVLHDIQGLVRKRRPSRSQPAHCMQRLDYTDRCKIANKFLNQFIRHQYPTHQNSTAVIKPIFLQYGNIQSLLPSNHSSLLLPYPASEVLEKRCPTHQHKHTALLHGLTAT